MSYAFLKAQGLYPDVSGVFKGFEPQFNYSSIADSNQFLINSRHHRIADEVYKTSFFFWLSHT
ncbi:MAG: hypothetical protein SNJ77_06135, partial [Cytophagales bacterium]